MTTQAIQKRAHPFAEERRCKTENTVESLDGRKSGENAGSLTYRYRQIDRDSIVTLENTLPAGPIPH
jgi:hypothetical protein